jgi:16S rRNA U516 pseudouridylate synthase RsuA-like enzyme
MSSDVQLYPIARLDCATEGLVVLSDAALVRRRLSQPRSMLEFLVQLEGAPTPQVVEQLVGGIDVRGSPFRVHFVRSLPVPTRPVFLMRSCVMVCV